MSTDQLILGSIYKQGRSVAFLGHYSRDHFSRGPGELQHRSAYVYPLFRSGNQINEMDSADKTETSYAENLTIDFNKVSDQLPNELTW